MLCAPLPLCVCARVNSCAADDVRFPFGARPVPCRPAALPNPVVSVDKTLGREVLKPQLGASGAAARNRRILRELSNYSRDPHECV